MGSIRIKDLPSLSRTIANADMFAVSANGQDCKVNVGALRTAFSLKPLNATENGTYNPADDNAYGYSPVTVNVRGSGAVMAFIKVTYMAGNVATCTKGAVTLTSDTSGNYIFDIPEEGTWVLTSGNITKAVTVAYGEAMSVNIQPDLPYSTEANIIALANVDNFVAQAETWGGLSRAYGSSTLYTDYVQSSQNFYYAAQSGEASFTIYLTYQAYTASLARMCAIYTSETNPGKPCFFQESGTLYAYDNGNVSTSKSSSAKHVLTVSRDDSTNIVKWYVDGALFRTSSGYNRPPIYTYFNGTGSSGYRATLNIYSMGVVLGAETDETVIANQAHLMNKYGMSA